MLKFFSNFKYILSYYYKNIINNNNYNIIYNIPQIKTRNFFLNKKIKEKSNLNNYLKYYQNHSFH